MWKNWILDVTNDCDPMCFCPIEDDGRVVTGMNVLADECPGKLVGIAHTDGRGATEEWMRNNKEIVEKLRAV